MTRSRDVEDLKEKLSASDIAVSVEPIEKSVRTTFRLEDGMRVALKRLSDALGASEKDTVDYCVALLSGYRKSEKATDLLRDLAANVTLADASRKTHVVTSSTIQILRELSEVSGLDRDQWVAAAIVLGEAQHELQRERRERAYRKLLTQIEEEHARLSDLEQRFEATIDEFPLDDEWMQLSPVGILDDWRSALESSLGASPASRGEGK